MLGRRLGGLRGSLGFDGGLKVDGNALSRTLDIELPGRRDISDDDIPRHDSTAPFCSSTCS